jgi:hypothetical protein
MQKISPRLLHLASPHIASILDDLLKLEGLNWVNNPFFVALEHKVHRNRWRDWPDKENNDRKGRVSMRRLVA